MKAAKRRSKAMVKVLKKGSKKRPIVKISAALRAKLSHVGDGLLEDASKYQNRPRGSWSSTSLSRGMPGNEEEDN